MLACGSYALRRRRFSLPAHPLGFVHKLRLCQALALATFVPGLHFLGSAVAPQPNTNCLPRKRIRYRDLNNFAGIDADLGTPMPVRANMRHMYRLRLWQLLSRFWEPARFMEGTIGRGAN